LESLIWPDWDRAQGDTPPDVRDKLGQAANGKFQPGNRSNIKRILASFE